MPTNDYRPNGSNIFNINWRKLRNGQSLPLEVYLDAPAAGYGLNISNDHWRGAETAEAFEGLRSVPPHDSRDRLKYSNDPMTVVIEPI